MPQMFLSSRMFSGSRIQPRVPYASREELARQIFAAMLNDDGSRSL